MITRQDIDNEAAFFQHLIEITNPTGGKHTPTPWHKGDVSDGWERSVEFYQTMIKGLTPEHNWAARSITDAKRNVIAFFLRPEDRDLALYFANVHPGVISMLRTIANAFEFIAKGADTNDGNRDFAKMQAEQARINADLLCRLGKSQELCDDDQTDNRA